MRGTKAKSLRRAVARFIKGQGGQNMPVGFVEYSWWYTDGQGMAHVGPCPRKLYLVAKERYKRKRGYPNGV